MMAHLSLSELEDGIDVKDLIATIKNLIKLEAPMLLFVSVLFVFGSSSLFFWVESDPDEGQQWLYSDVLWFIVISTTTIGLGDMSPDWNRVGAAVFEVAVMALGVVLIALTVGLLVSLFESKLEKAGGLFRQTKPHREMSTINVAPQKPGKFNKIHTAPEGNQKPAADPKL